MVHPTTKTTAPRTSPWSLEVIRGREVGRIYALEPGETVLGNAIDGGPGLDLGDQEGGGPRRMAARHATLASTGQDLTIRDLETPGGTFVNRQRLLSGQPRRLQSGDVIQLGGVQLVVKGNGVATPAAPVPTPAAVSSPAASSPSAPKPAAARPSSTAPGRLPVPFSMAEGAVCRTWDDFLVLAAQRWTSLRGELASGRLADYLRLIQRIDLIVRPQQGQSDDDLLDAWLARLPVTRSAAPELDVHPGSLQVRAVGGGGITRHTLRLTNVGYRLLRCTARVEPAGTRWVRLRPEHDGRSFPTIDQTDLPVEVEIPETFAGPLSAAIVLEGNGGTRRVDVRIERPPASEAIPEMAVGGLAPEIPGWVSDLRRSVARLRPGVRVAIGAAGAILLRLLVGLASRLPVGARGDQIVEPRLTSMAIVLAGLGMLAGGMLALRTGERRDLPTLGFAGGLLGLLAAAVWFAVIRSVESALGSWSSSILAVGLLWGLIGAACGLVSAISIPPEGDKQESAI